MLPVSSLMGAQCSLVGAASHLQMILVLDILTFFIQALRLKLLYSFDHVQSK